MRISDWSSDVCSSDLSPAASRLVIGILTALTSGNEHERCGHRQGWERHGRHAEPFHAVARRHAALVERHGARAADDARLCARSEEHTSELQSLMRISYAVFCLKKKKTQ